MRIVGRWLPYVANYALDSFVSSKFTRRTFFFQEAPVRAGNWLTALWRLPGQKENEHSTAQHGPTPKSLNRKQSAAPNNHPCSPPLAPSTRRKTTRGPRSQNVRKSGPRALANGSQSEADSRNRKHYREYSFVHCGRGFVSKNQPRFGIQLLTRAARF